jgi:hypothetical protein
VRATELEVGAGSARIWNGRIAGDHMSGGAKLRGCGPCCTLRMILRGVHTATAPVICRCLKVLKMQLR